MMLIWWNKGKTMTGITVPQLIVCNIDVDILLAYSHTEFESGGTNEKDECLVNTHPVRPHR